LETAIKTLHFDTIRKLCTTTHTVTQEHENMSYSTTLDKPLIHHRLTSPLVTV